MKRTYYFLFLLLTIMYIVFSIHFKRQKRQEAKYQLKSAENVGNFTHNFPLFDIDLKYLINSRVCQNSPGILAIILVTSYFGNLETRSSMRNAFSSSQLEFLGLRRVFLLGEAPHDRYTSVKVIEDEAAAYGDIVQGNFIEAYRNLTYKHMMGMNWVDKFCSNAKYVVKMDDDIVVNLIEFVDILQHLLLPKDSFAGYILRDLKPIRETDNKWYVTKDEFSGNSYPMFVSGWFYITTPRIYHDLLDIFYKLKPKYFWIDDLFVTGILARKLGLRYYDLAKYFAVNSEYIECCIHDIEKYNLKCDFIIGPNGGDTNLYYKFNVAVKQCIISNCDDRNKSIEKTCVAEKKLHLTKGNAVISAYKLH